MKSALGLVFFLVLTALLRCYNFGEVFAPDHIFFVDGDCYSRMERVRQVLARPLEIPRHDTFENYPEGTDPHTTVPMDYAIALLAVVLRPFFPDATDLAGAWISPLLGVLTAAFLWFWFGRAKLPYRGAALLLFACSPILVHGLVLGRPDHQSLQMLFLAVAVGADWILAREGSRPWAIIWGLAWGAALWTSLYEPAILLLLVFLLRFAMQPKAQFSRNWLCGYATLAAVLGIFLAIEHWRIQKPDALLLHYFPAWEKTIGELASLRPYSPVFLGWLGLTAAAAPLLLPLAARKERRAIPTWIFLAVLFGLTCWQARWGYFLGVFYVMALPLVLAPFPRRWIAWSLFLLSLWPVLKEWDLHLVPSDRAGAAEKLAENEQLYDLSRHLAGEEGGILAPWWMSPALSYWSGLPAIGGTSHESLPGIVASARFYLTDDPEEALAILEKRKVRWVAAYDPERTLETASTLLGKPAPERTMAEELYEWPHSAPAFLRLEYANRAFKLFSVGSTAPK